MRGVCEAPPDTTLPRRRGCRARVRVLCLASSEVLPRGARYVFSSVSHPRADLLPLAAREYSVRFVGGHPLVSRAAAAAAALPFDPVPRLLVPGPLPVPADFLHAYREAPSDSPAPPPAASVPAAGPVRRTRSAPQRGGPSRPSSLQSRTRALATQARQAVTSTSRLVAIARGSADEDESGDGGRSTDEEEDQLPDGPESESSQ